MCSLISQRVAATRRTDQEMQGTSCLLTDSCEAASNGNDLDQGVSSRVPQSSEAWETPRAAAGPRPPDHTLLQPEQLFFIFLFLC